MRPPCWCPSLSVSTRNEAANEINIPTFSSHLRRYFHGVHENWKVMQKLYDILRIPVFLAATRSWIKFQTVLFVKRSSIST